MPTGAGSGGEGKGAGVEEEEQEREKAKERGEEKEGARWSQKTEDLSVREVLRLAGTLFKVLAERKTWLRRQFV
jgi:hypothetical protein